MNVDFVTAVKMFFINYVNFKGRSTRAEYWWAMLFYVIVSSIPFVSYIAMLACLLPMLAINTRRLHDTGRSGWWLVGFFVISLVLGGWMVSAMLPYLQMAGSTNFDLTHITSMLKDAAAPFFINMILSIAWIVLMCLPSGPDNKYGPNPYGEN